MANLEQFTNVYSPDDKTLRFKLEPVYVNIDDIKRMGLLENDKHRAESYKKVKKIIDEYHKKFIDSVLGKFCLQYDDKGGNNSLSEYYTMYLCKSKDETLKTRFEEIQKNLREQIVESFRNDDRYKNLFKKELIKEDLQTFVKSEDLKLIEEFKSFTTYFTGFNENRKNMYSSEANSTAIAYRLIHENLPKFIDNMQIFDIVVTSPVSNKFAELCNNLKEDLNVAEIKDLFRLDYYNNVLTQEQIEVYNTVIGGKTLDDGTKIKGLNEYINQYNQHQKDKSSRLPKFKPLFKQILSDRVGISAQIEQFESDETLLEAIQGAYQEFDKQVFNKKKEGEHSLKDLLKTLADYDLNHIYIRNDLQLTDISQKLFGHWNIISESLVEELKTSVQKKSKNETDEAYEERLRKILKTQGSISIAQINDSVKKQNPNCQLSVQDYFYALGANINGKEKENLFSQIENAYTDVKELLNTPYQGKKLAQDKRNIDKIKNLLDAIKSVQHFIKPLLGEGSEPDKDEKFYGEFIPLWDELNKITNLYNMVRNYMTRKPYVKDKIRVHFDNNGLFLNGWVDSKTEKSDNGTQYGGYLFRRKNAIGEFDYYLGISSDTKLFRRDKVVDKSDISQYERLDYYQLKSQTIYGNAFQGDYKKDSMQIIKAIDSVIKRKGDNTLINKIDRDRKAKNPKTNTAKGYLSFVKQYNIDIYDAVVNNPIFIKANLQLIKSIKETLLTLKRIPKAQKIAKNDFMLFTDIMNEIEKLVKEKVFTYIPVSNSEFKTAIEREQKALYLFKISNKDLSFAESYSNGLRKSRGRENLHTMYFKALMEGNQNVFDIGPGAIYFREQGIKYSEEELRRGHHYDILKDKFPYPIISKKRYAKDLFQFHLSIKQNYLADKTNDTEMNRRVNKYIQQSEDLHIIGIDRGERNLLYLTVIDLKGQIKKQYSLNEIINTHNGNEYHTNYHELLKNREGDRTKARQSWQTIENIKDLKEGYLSQVVHKISELIVEYNAIVVLEDLNMGFKRGRQKVEHSVYQKFEKMLIDKLNYLADKKKTPTEPGGILNAYQLTNKFESFQKLGKQSGFLFYTQAWNTSKIDPVTGFVNLFDTRYETIEKSRTFFSKFDSIIYNKDKDLFEFSFDYSNFTTKADGTRTKWTICTYGKRVETYRDETQNSNWASHEIDLTEKFKFFFNGYKVDIHSNLKESIVQQDSAKFFKELLYLLKLTLQMRNSETGTDVDYLQSPVADSNGMFYNSNTCDSSLPQNADANGAYNIALKGLWIVREIKAAENLDNLKLAISNKEWLQFAQTKPYLND